MPATHPFPRTQVERETFANELLKDIRDAMTPVFREAAAPWPAEPRRRSYWPRPIDERLRSSEAMRKQMDSRNRGTWLKLLAGSAACVMFHLSPALAQRFTEAPQGPWMDKS